MTSKFHDFITENKSISASCEPTSDPEGKNQSEKYGPSTTYEYLNSNYVIL